MDNKFTEFNELNGTGETKKTETAFVLQVIPLIYSC